MPLFTPTTPFDGEVGKNCFRAEKNYDIYLRYDKFDSLDISRLIKMTQTDRHLTLALYTKHWSHTKILWISIMFSVQIK